MKRRVFITLLVILPLLVSPLVVHGQGGATHEHIVCAGQTLYSIAKLYKVQIKDIKDANKLTSDTIYVGQKLLIPLPQPLAVHTVARGETLYKIAVKYGVRLLDIVWANHITSPNLINIGQELVIPPTKGSVISTATATPKATPTATPTPTSGAVAPAVQEAIVITSPILNSRITSPVTVTGWGSGFENNLAVTILDEEGKTIGQGFVTVDAEFGQYGPFTGKVTFTMPTKAQVGKVQVYSVSARDGSIDHLSSVMVKFQP